MKIYLILLLILGLSSKIENNKKEIVKLANQIETDRFGYSLDKLNMAKEWADSNTQTAAVVVLVDGKVLTQWGETEKKYLTHSCRKSFMSALYGIYIERGIIDIDATLEELEIDDIPPLSEQEKSATIRDCIQSCSGVFHTAEAESAGMHNLKPDRDKHLPGTFWIYNNWDFNVLRTIFEQQTGLNFYSALKKDILDPIGANFTLEDSLSWPPSRSIHRAYMFQISALDMAKFGQLMLQNGNWDGNQIIPKDWIEESTQSYWDAEIYGGDGYGYMWWVATNKHKYPYLPNCSLPAGTYSARGAGGHWIEIIPEYNMVFVHRTDTWQRHKVSSSNIGTILQKILDARL